MYGTFATSERCRDEDAAGIISIWKIYPFFAHPQADRRDRAPPPCYSRLHLEKQGLGGETRRPERDTRRLSSSGRVGQDKVRKVVRIVDGVWIAGLPSNSDAEQVNYVHDDPGLIAQAS